MIIIRNINQIKSLSNLALSNLALPNLALTIGNFDGMHLGHLAIVNQIKKVAKEKKLASAIITFEPHPISFFNAEKKKNFRITTLAQKLNLFQENGIDYAIILPFNQKTSEITALDFINDILVTKLNTKELIIGYDFIFGKDRQGDFNLLEQESKNLGFNLTEIAAVKIDDQTSSSSIVRQLISNGNVSEANKLLNKSFAISGLVNQGRKLASQLGFPTANLNPKPHQIMPKFGVYKSSTFIHHLNQTFPSITNFGIKPTITNHQTPLFETHIPAFDQMIYGKKVTVNFLEFIREEKEFSSIEELKKQITKDVSLI